MREVQLLNYSDTLLYWLIKVELFVDLILELRFSALKLGWIPVVFDGIIAASEEHITYIGPAIVRLLQCDQDIFFIWGPLLRHFKERVQLIVPSFSALLSIAIRDLLRYHFPVLRADLSY